MVHTVNKFYFRFTVISLHLIGAASKCKKYSGSTVKNGRQWITVYFWILDTCSELNQFSQLILAQIAARKKCIVLSCRLTKRSSCQSAKVFNIFWHYSPESISSIMKKLKWQKISIC